MSLLEYIQQFMSGLRMHDVGKEVTMIVDAKTFHTLRSDIDTKVAVKEYGDDYDEVYKFKIFSSFGEVVFINEDYKVGKLFKF